VIVLSQLDTRYFYGLEGVYGFTLQFRLEKDGDEEDDYIVRSPASYAMTRDVSTDLELDIGVYSVLMKITAVRNAGEETAEETVRQYAKTRSEKLVQIGLSYDLAHAKGRIVESAEERKEREEGEKRRSKAEWKKLRDALEARAKRAWELERKRWRRERKRNAKAEKARSKNNAVSKEQLKSATASCVPAHESWAGGDGPVDVDEHPHFASGGGGDVHRGKPSPPQDLVQPLEEVVTAAAIQSAIPEIHINGVQKVNEIKALDGPLNPHSGVHDSETDSFHDFDFDSELDIAPDHVDKEDAKSPCPLLHRDGGDDDVETDPWNAICVVGLRVYSKNKRLSLQVKRPKNDTDAEAPLDRDDPAKGASKESNGEPDDKL